jgi:hypothetical protein
MNDKKLSTENFSRLELEDLHCGNCKKCQGDIQEVKLSEVADLTVCANCLVAIHWKDMEKFFDELADQQNEFLNGLAKESGIETDRTIENAIKIIRLTGELKDRERYIEKFKEMTQELTNQYAKSISKDKRSINQLRGMVFKKNARIKELEKQLKGKHGK